MPQSSTMSRTLILFKGFSFKSFIKEALIACFVKFAINVSLLYIPDIGQMQDTDFLPLNAPHFVSNYIQNKNYVKR